jgi:hypothetical protein
LASRSRRKPSSGRAGDEIACPTYRRACRFPETPGHGLNGQLDRFRDLHLPSGRDRFPPFFGGILDAFIELGFRQSECRVVTRLSREILVPPDILTAAALDYFVGNELPVVWSKLILVTGLEVID